VCDCEQPDPRRSDPNECFLCGEPLSEKQLFNELLSESEYVKHLESRVADLEAILDDLPKMTALYQAVKEIQEQYEKPGMTFSHYLVG